MVDFFVQRQLRGRSVDFDSEEELAKKQAKMDQRRKKMWKANHYISTSIVATTWVEEDTPLAPENLDAEDVKSEWSCETCTFTNSMELEKCEMCNSTRTTRSGKTIAREVRSVCLFFIHHLFLTLSLREMSKRKKRARIWTKRVVRPTTYILSLVMSLAQSTRLR